MSKHVKDISYYIGLPYTTVIRRDEEGDFVARIAELPGCLAHGSDEGEAIVNLRSMQRLWIEDAIEAGDSIPEPETEEALPSGKWVQRVPRSLHGRLVRAARAEGVSLNQLVTSMLSQSLGVRTFEQHAKRLFAGYAAHLERMGVHHVPAAFGQYWIATAKQKPSEWSLEGAYQSDIRDLSSLSHVFSEMDYFRCPSKT